MRSVPSVNPVIAKARDVFDRCSTGRAREQDVGQMDGTLDQVRPRLPARARSK
jgi:hypothetical protein